MIYFLMFFLAFWAGFSVRRASLCLVRATIEIMQRKPAKTLFFVLQAMVVALSITIPALLFFPNQVSVASSYNISWYLLVGPVLYGFGASLNGSCALGTLNQLMNGKVEFLFTIIGLSIGFFIFLKTQDGIMLQKLDTSHIQNNQIFYLVPLMLIVWSISFVQIRKFLLTSEESKARKMKQYLKSSVARDFIGISIFGLCSGTLFLLLGSSWDYTQFIQFVEINIFQQNLAVHKNIFPLMVTTSALVMGIGLASILSKDFKFRWGNVNEYFLKTFAGGLMGFGVGLIPGGNDTLILYGIPGLALHAPVALMIMMASIAILHLIGNKLRES